MQEFLVLLGEILLIACLQSIFEVFLNTEKHPYQGQMLTVACFMGSLYLLLQFVGDHLFQELAMVLRLQF